MKHQAQAYPLRLPSELMAWVKEQACKENRSVNNFISILVRNAKEALHAPT